MPNAVDLLFIGAHDWGMKADIYQALCDAASAFDDCMFSRTTCGVVLFSLRDDKGRWHTLERVEDILLPMMLEMVSLEKAVQMVVYLSLRLYACVCTECGFVEFGDIEPVHLECETPALAGYRGKRVCVDCIELIVDDY